MADEDLERSFVEPSVAAHRAAPRSNFSPKWGAETAVAAGKVVKVIGRLFLSLTSPAGD
jgi:hypothetical protein